MVRSRREEANTKNTAFCFGVGHQAHGTIAALSIATHSCSNKEMTVVRTYMRAASLATRGYEVDLQLFFLPRGSWRRADKLIVVTGKFTRAKRNVTTEFEAMNIYGVIHPTQAPANPQPTNVFQVKKTYGSCDSKGIFRRRRFLQDFPACLMEGE